MPSNREDWCVILIEEMETDNLTSLTLDLNWLNSSSHWHHMGKVSRTLYITILCLLSIAENKVKPIALAIFSVVFKSTQGVEDATWQLLIDHRLRWKSYLLEVVFWSTVVD